MPPPPIFIKALPLRNIPVITGASPFVLESFPVCSANIWVLGHDINSKVSWLDLQEREHQVVEAWFRNSFLNIVTKEQKEFWSSFCHLEALLGGLCLQASHDRGDNLTFIHETFYLQTLYWAGFWHQLTGDASGSSLHICRNLSGRADECSGPWGRHKMEQKDKSDVLQAYCSSCRRMLQISDVTIPSMPWGSSRTIPFWRTHLAWPELMNWSMMHWAVLWKSPNWASHRTSAFGLAIAKPNSKPAPNSRQKHIYVNKCSDDLQERSVLGYLRLRTQTASCCTRCKELDWQRCGSSGCRSSYQRSGHEEHDAGGCETERRETTVVQIWIIRLFSGHLLT